MIVTKEQHHLSLSLEDFIGAVRARLAFPQNPEDRRLITALQTLAQSYELRNLCKVIHMVSKHFKRKPTAILSADVEGYSRLMGDDEAAMARTLTAYRETMGKYI